MTRVTDEMRKKLAAFYVAELTEESMFSIVKDIAEMCEENKPKPVGYIYKHRLNEMLTVKGDSDCTFFAIKDPVSAAIFNKTSEKYLALYTTPPRDPSIDHELLCDVCGAVVGDDVNHFSSSTNPHIHICGQCVEKYQYDRFFIDVELEKLMKQE